MNVVGLDVSLCATGIADRQGPRVIECKKLKGAERLMFFRDHLGKLWGNDEPDLLVVEGYSYASTHRAESIGELGGVVRLLAYELSIDLAVVSPKTLKLYATGKGNAPKDWMVANALVNGARIPSRTRRDGSLSYDDNAADAFWLQHMGICAQTYRDADTLAGLQPHEVQALQSVDWP